MANNEIALSFEKTEYYTLQEACDYLNLKHKTNNITPKKLLKHISNHEINTYIHFRMDNLDHDDCLGISIGSYDSNVFENLDNFEMDNFLRNRVLNIFNKLEYSIQTMIFDNLYIGHFMFLVDDLTIKNMSLQSTNIIKERLLLLDGFLTVDDLNDNPHNPKILQDRYITVDGKTYIMKNIASMNLKLTCIDDDVIADFKNKFPYQFSLDKRDGGWAFVDFNIDINDLIIIHQDLEALEHKIINDFPIEKKLLDRKKGISLQKQIAQELAKAHAKYLWDKDHEQKIRMSEMCDKVYKYLVEMDYTTELPDDVKSLKLWIKDIAPEHAKEKGRPPKES